MKNKRWNVTKIYFWIIRLFRYLKIFPSKFHFSPLWVYEFCNHEKDKPYKWKGLECFLTSVMLCSGDRSRANLPSGSSHRKLQHSWIMCAALEFWPIVSPCWQLYCNNSKNYKAKEQVTFKGRRIRIMLYFSMELWKPEKPVRCVQTLWDHRWQSDYYTQQNI